MSVVLNGNTYDVTDFVGSDGRGYYETFAATGLTLFPNSIFTDMLAEIAAATSVQGVSPGAANGMLVSNGTAWVRSTAINGVTVGATTPAAGAFTTLSASSTLAVTGTSTLTGNVGVGRAVATTVGVAVGGTVGTGTALYGFHASPAFPATTTVSGTGLYSRIDTAAASFTMATAYAIYAANAGKGSGSTITTQYGLYVESLTSGDTNIPIFTAGTGPWIMGATAKLRFDGSATGDTYITESSANVLDLYAGAAKQLSLTATTATVAGNLIVSGAGPHAIGGAAVSNTGLNITGAFTAAASTLAAGVRVATDLTCGSGATDVGLFLLGSVTGASITTQGASQTIPVVATLYVDEPGVVVGTGDTVTATACVYIKQVATEGGSNYALFVDAGASRFDGSVLSSSATGGLGYMTGAGGAVEQATSRTTGVTLDKVCGAITLFSAAGDATNWTTFTVTNSTVAATDVVNVCQKSGTDLYEMHVTNVATGSFKITFRTTAGTTTEQPVFNFAVHKAVAA